MRDATGHGTTFERRSSGEGGSATLVVEGHLGSAAAPRLREELDRLPVHGAEVDLAGCTFVGAAAARELVRAVRRRDGALGVRGAEGTVGALLEVAGAEELVGPPGVLVHH